MRQEHIEIILLVMLFVGILMLIAKERGER